MSRVLSKVASATFVVSGIAMFIVGISFVVEGFAQANFWKLMTAVFIFCPVFFALIYGFIIREP